MDLSVHMRRMVDRYIPITAEGVTLYPITVAELEIFNSTRPALEFMHQILPVSMMQIPLLTALYQLELTMPTKETEVKFDLFTKTVLLLALSLRLGYGLPEAQRISRCGVEYDPENPLNLLALQFRTDSGGEIRITPEQYGRLRYIIAAQNGAEIQPYDANPQLVFAERQILADRAPDLKKDLANKVAWVAAKSSEKEEAVYDWPILKFERRATVLQTELNYLIYGIAQCSGLVKYENGNPCPSPYFEREVDAIPAKMLSSIGNGAAAKAVSAAAGRNQTP